MNITDRQKLILLAIIKEFMNSADEVGSSTLVEKYEIPASSATIRSEMVHLMDQGLLEKSHISSGRFPTDQAIRFYVDEAITKPNLSTIDEALVRQEIFKVRFSKEDLIREILNTLVIQCNSAAFVFMDDMSRYFGVSSLSKYEELRHINVLQRVLDVLEDKNLLTKIFSKYLGNEVGLLIGRESGIKDLENCSLVFTKISIQKDVVGYMGIIGSRRLDYAKVIPLLKTIRNSIENSLKGWM